MLFKRKGQAAGQLPEEKSLYPVLHVANSLKEYQQELVKKEVASLWELSQVGDSFGDVLSDGDQFQAKLLNLEASFSNISETVEQFSNSLDNYMTLMSNKMEILADSPVIQEELNAAPNDYRKG